jgi:hypothetical protein
MQPCLGGWVTPKRIFRLFLIQPTYSKLAHYHYIVIKLIFLKKKSVGGEDYKKEFVEVPNLATTVSCSVFWFAGDGGGMSTGAHVLRVPAVVVHKLPCWELVLRELYFKWPSWHPSLLSSVYLGHTLPSFPRLLYPWVCQGPIWVVHSVLTSASECHAPHLPPYVPQA